ncbi:hypothetical protein SAMN06265173_1105 [Thalassovita litoralis]|jgi:hypothetical protein|uniref:Uncharacterized protein n=1 Tax=Thalassovita litoralis TaxID=1010611 RepID=A0A521DAV9_9RHOB|nr:hypothetical protein SAMN06265173_1105 [Thalassovita litoralis]
MRLISVIVAALCMGPMAQAQTTAWLGGMTSTETEKTYSYGTQIPKDVGTWLMQNGTRVTHPTDQGGSRLLRSVSRLGH